MVENREALLALAERCEAARIDPSLWYLEDDIYTAITGKEPFNSATSPRYGTSLDAAMTLVPEGWVWTVNTFAEPNRSASAYLMNEGNEQIRPRQQYLATPALALCAAALRAHAARLTQSTEDDRG